MTALATALRTKTKIIQDGDWCPDCGQYSYSFERSITRTHTHDNFHLRKLLVRPWRACVRLFQLLLVTNNYTCLISRRVYQAAKRLSYHILDCTIFLTMIHHIF